MEREVELVTEPMLSALLRAKAVRWIVLKPERGKGPLKKQAWGVEICLTLPARQPDKVRGWFDGRREHKIKPAALVERLCERVEEGQSQLHVKLVPYRQTVHPTSARVRTVASLDRFVTRLRHLGARDINIRVDVGDNNATVD